MAGEVNPPPLLEDGATTLTSSLAKNISFPSLSTKKSTFPLLSSSLIHEESAPLEENVKQPHLSSQALYSDVVKRNGLQSISAVRSSSQALLAQPAPQIFDPYTTTLKELSLYEGKPSVVFPSSEQQALIEKLKYVLVGKFSHGRPTMEYIKKFFDNLKLKGTCNPVFFDKKHIFIECVCKEDYYRIWLKLKWIIDGYAMRVFKWTPDFSPNKESSFAPVWIRVEGLPLYLFDEMSLLSISNAIGRPIRVDFRNVNRSMLNSARICVELDVCKPLLDTILISFKDEVSKNVVEKFWVKIFYDEVPLFCSSCGHIGHGSGICKRKGVISAQGMEVTNTADKVLDRKGLAASCDSTISAQPINSARVKGNAATGSDAASVSQLGTVKGDQKGTAIADGQSQSLGATTSDANAEVQQGPGDSDSAASLKIMDDSLHSADLEINPVDVAKCGTTNSALISNPIQGSRAEPDAAAILAGADTAIFDQQLSVIAAKSDQEQLLDTEKAADTNQACNSADYGAEIDFQQTVDRGAMDCSATVNENRTEVVVATAASSVQQISDTADEFPAPGSKVVSADQVQHQQAAVERTEAVDHGDKKNETESAQDVVPVDVSAAVSDTFYKLDQIETGDAEIDKELTDTVTQQQENNNSEIDAPIETTTATTVESVQQHTYGSGDLSKANETVIPKTPVKGCLAEVNTPGSWADIADEEERHKKISSFTTKANPLTRRSVSPTSRMSEKIKTFRSSPIDFDFDPGIRFHKDAKEVQTWSEIITGKFKIVARRSVSPVGRSSEKLKRMRRRVDFIEHEAGKTEMCDRKIYLKNNEEFYQAAVEYRRSLRRQHYHHRSDRGRNRGRGFGRGNGPGRFMGCGRRGRFRDRERTVIC